MSAVGDEVQRMADTFLRAPHPASRMQNAVDDLIRHVGASSPLSGLRAAMWQMLNPPKLRSLGPLARSVPPPPPVTIRETLARFRDLPRVEPMKVVMSSKHLDAVAVASAVRPEGAA